MEPHGGGWRIDHTQRDQIRLGPRVPTITPTINIIVGEHGTRRHRRTCLACRYVSLVYARTGGEEEKGEAQRSCGWKPEQRKEGRSPEELRVEARAEKRRRRKEEGGGGRGRKEEEGGGPVATGKAGRAGQTTTGLCQICTIIT